MIIGLFAVILMMAGISQMPLKKFLRQERSDVEAQAA
jgi:hypothetical protein